MTRLQRDIAALADGSGEAPGLRERIAGSPELAALLEEQRRAIAAVRGAQPAAPAALRAAVEAGPTGAAARRPRRPALGLLVATAGVVALTVVAVLPSGAAPSVARVASLAGRPAAAPPPPADPAHRGSLATEFAGVRYPDWQAAFGWRSVGRRTDQLDGRPTMTVLYANAGARISYTIVGGAALPEPGRAQVQPLAGTRYLGLADVGGRPVVTWRRAGHTCVLTGAGVPLATLERLAEWRYDATPT